MEGFMKDFIINTNGAWLRVQLTLQDRQGSEADLAKEALHSFTQITANSPTVAAASYFRAINIRRVSYRLDSRHGDTHLDALRSALDRVEMVAGDENEIVVVGPCGFDDCRCDSDRYAMRWTFVAERVFEQPEGCAYQPGDTSFRSAGYPLTLSLQLCCKRSPWRATIFRYVRISTTTLLFSQY
jgi:hypothetical protein